ncbi:MAG: DUF393 domain-containing protein [Marinilabiliales bacterium]|nr:MAG: DUF393 domain-containing protein [Marinilabiliales bacterium]
MSGKTFREKENNKLFVLFDGHCVLCSRTVNFIIRRDKKDLFRFAPLQGPGISGKIPGSWIPENNDSVILIEKGRVWHRSSAVLRIMRRLPYGWPLLYLLIIIPAPVRDFFYKFVAKSRYRWFGRYDNCLVPDKRIRNKFTEDIPIQID